MLRALALSLIVAAVTGCATSRQETPPVRIVDRGANPVSLWAERGTATINQPPLPTDGIVPSRRCAT